MDSALIKKAADVLSIQEVLLGSHSVLLRADFDPKNVPPATSSISTWGPVSAAVQELTDNVTNKIVGRIWRVEFSTQVRLVPTPHSGELTKNNLPSESETIANIQARFFLYYALKLDAPVDDVALTEFAKYNVSYHAWPYWREWLQSVCIRTGLPTIRLRMHFVNSEGADAAESRSSSKRTSLGRLRTSK